MKNQNKNKNQNKKARKIIILSSLSVIILAMAGCGLNHKNKLLQDNPKQVANLIYHAEYYARTKNSFIGTYEYMRCVQDPDTNGKKICNKLFDLMHSYINKQKGYSSVNVPDLKDIKVWERISKDIDFLYANS